MKQNTWTHSLGWQPLQLLRITGSTVQYPWYHLKSKKAGEGRDRKLGQRLREDMRKEVCMVVSGIIPHVIYAYSEC